MMLMMFTIKQLLAQKNVTSIQFSGTVWTGMIKTNKHFRIFFFKMMNDLSFLYTLFQERDVLRSSERIRRDHLGVFCGL